MNEELTTFVERYVGMWNESDPVRRRRTIEQLWTPHGANFTPTIEAVGHDQLESRVAKSYRTYVGTGQYRFRLAEPPVGHHNAVKVVWEMVALADRTVASTGLEFLVRSDDGRIVTDHQFIIG